VGVVFVFPDGDAGFYLVEDPAAGVEGGAAVRGGDADPDGDVADGQVAGAVDAGGGGEIEAGEGFGEDGFAFPFRQVGIGLVAQAGDGATLVVVADPALEAGTGAGAGVEQALAQGGGVQGLRAQGETLHGLASATGDRRNESHHAAGP